MASGDNSEKRETLADLGDMASGKEMQHSLRVLNF